MRYHSKLLGLAAVLSVLAAGSVRGQDEEMADPLGDIIVDMQVAGGRLGKMQTDKTTQQKQKDAVDKLGALIKLLEQRRRGNGPGGGMPEKPADDSNILGGPGGSGPLHAANRNGRSWGTLPEHKRNQILQSMNEGFPAHYQQILERYYRRLAEEKPAGEAADDAAPVAKAGDASASKAAATRPAMPDKKSAAEPTQP